jgi:DNA-directed RNA polymerase specialized sigma24 family protein
LPKIEPREPDELFAAARAGERAGFTALVRLHQARVYGIALRMLMDRALAVLRQHLQSLIVRLAPMPRAVMLLRYQEDLDPLDIARTLGIPVNTVKSHLKRSLAALRTQLSGLAPIGGGGEA